MSTAELAETLIEEIENEDGFVLKVRVYNNFDENALARLLEILNQYHHALGDDELINRSVAYWLYVTPGILLNVLAFYESSSHPNETKLKDAIHAIRIASEKVLDSTALKRNSNS